MASRSGRLHTPTIAKGMDYDHSVDTPETTKVLWRASEECLRIARTALAGKKEEPRPGARAAVEQKTEGT